MSYARSLLTPVLVTIIGVGTGKQTFTLSNIRPLTFVQALRYLTQHSSKRKSRESMRSTSSRDSVQIYRLRTNISHRVVEIENQHVPPPEEQIRQTEEAVANAGGATTIPKDMERWSEVQTGHFSKPVNTFRWSEVPLDQYSSPEKSS